ncbi:Retinoid-inducible serine carboxypeptidase [Hypsibius exemplaris]|uniref:Carboxypeptidase n=1 Tax=Hypsibius exemplaris TaxID=2072580 RepID=A0A1W0WSA2_HYPEX|nr:Retinoid-inducible serine carboxypeptidase [Hypsibius exemplaris]
MEFILPYFLALLLLISCSYVHSRKPADADSDWGYISVRPDTNTFWWLYNYQGENPNPPLVLWLQGGPGGSGAGFGNFAEIGPLDVNLQPRNTTWLKEASLLFIDNPVGTGFSYVTNDNAYAKSVDQIAEDLVEFFRQFFKAKPELQSSPFYVFSESYGGKMTAAFGVHMWKAIQKGKIVCKFSGVAMGDSWVHPEIIVESWGRYLYSTSFVDSNGLDVVDESAKAISNAIAAGNWTGATALWDASEDIVAGVTGGVDWYNILNPIATHGQRLHASRRTAKLSRRIKNPVLKRLYQRHMAVHQNDALDVLMNGPIRKKLGIIPTNVTWGGQSADVFTNQEEEFMKPVTDSVDYLLKKTTNLKVVVYNGQLDLICDTMGVEAWVQTLAWPGLPSFNSAKRSQLALSDTGNLVGYKKTYKNFYFYWMLRGGHMLPADQGEASLLMLGDIINTSH